MVLALLLGASASFAMPPGFSRTRLWSPQRTPHEFFGRGVTSTGGRLVVGAPGGMAAPFAGLPGRVYVLDLDGVVSLVIENPTPASGDVFGASVAMAGGNIAVGAAGDDTAAPDAGAAYLFDGVTGALLQTLLVPGAGANAQCGRSVAGLGDDVLVLCDGVYRFDGGTGALVRHYTAPGCLGGRGMATIDDDVLSAGYDGTICRFDGTTGAVVQTYVDPERALGGAFGTSIGVDGGLVVVGGAYFSGARESLYVFDGATGALVHTIRGPSYGTPYNAGFGTSVAAADGVILGSGWNATRFYAAASFAELGFWQGDDPRQDASRDTVTPVFGDAFALWTDTIDPNVGFGSVTVFDRCGNGIHAPAEQCDDGNTADGDGCSATCRLELCPPTPPVGCHGLGADGGASIVLQKRTSGNWAVNADRLVWKWKGTAPLADFGDPTAASTYQLCFYDDLLGTPDRRLTFVAPAGGLCGGRPCWKRLGGTGFGYADPERTPSGVEKMTLQASGVRARIAVTGKGERLALPDVGGPDDRFPFAPGWVAVLMESESGRCWSAGSGSALNRAGRFIGAAGGS